jgi:hypothetical protein
VASKHPIGGRGLKRRRRRRRRRRRMGIFNVLQ